MVPLCHLQVQNIILILIIITSPFLVQILAKFQIFAEGQNNTYGQIKSHLNLVKFRTGFSCGTASLLQPCSDHIYIARDSTLLHKHFLSYRTHRFSHLRYMLSHHKLLKSRFWNKHNHSGCSVTL